jgi:hypothetical protein
MYSYYFVEKNNRINGGEHFFKVFGFFIIWVFVSKKPKILKKCSCWIYRKEFTLPLYKTTMENESCLLQEQ